MRENLQLNRWIEQLLPKETFKGLVLLTGARQTGKTTSARRQYQTLSYYSLDAIEFREQLSAVSSFAWAKTVGKAVLDEIQKEPALLDKIKFSFDQGGLPFSVLLGSAQILLLKNVKETLAGRVFVYEMFPLMLSELSSSGQAELRTPLIGKLLNSENPSEVLRNEPEVLLGESADRIKQAEQHILQWGAMPGLLPLNAAMRQRWLKSYELTYLERDLGDLARLDDLKPFRRFQRLTALRSGQILSFSELAKDAGVAVETARRYLEYLRLSYQAFLVQPFAENITSQVVKTPKVFWLDCGLLRSLAGLSPDAPMDGHFYESYVAAELLKWIRTQQADAQLFYYRTRSGLEVDFLLQTPRGLLAIEVKGRTKVERSDFSTMKRLAEKLGKRWLGGMVLYRGDRIDEVEPAYWAVPSWRLFS